MTSDYLCTLTLLFVACFDQFYVCFIVDQVRLLKQRAECPKQCFLSVVQLFFCSGPCSDRDEKQQAE